MTYADWRKDFFNKRNKIVEKLKKLNYSEEKIYEYFEYDNMSLKESSFCPLYELNKKCHDIEYLNCFHCACPHFVIVGDDSFCKINSKFADNIVINNNKICDCTNCTIPHTKQFKFKK